MKDYMNVYETWEANGFLNDGWRTAALNVQDAVMAAVQGLYKSPNYHPPEVACPP